MRPLLLAFTLALPSAVFAAPAPVAATDVPTGGEAAMQADWRREGVDDRIKAGLTSQGWRFEDDGRALEPKSQAAAAKGVLDKAVRDLLMDARRAALEAVNVMLDPNRTPELTDGARLAMLAQDLPPGLAKAVLDPKSDLAKTRAMAVAELDTVASYFDGSRTMAERQAAAQPVSAGTPGPRAAHPYYTAQENSVGDKLRDSAASVIGQDPFGMIILSRLNGRNGKPDLPPVVIEDQSGDAVARYDIRRGAIVLDREGVLSSIVGAEPPAKRAALRTALSTRAALLAYLDAHPEAVATVARDNDALIAHELTHAWQDRRDPIFREMARGNLPAAQPLEYEEEAYKTKNLYIRSKLKHDPASVKMDEEFRDYTVMTHGAVSWTQELFRKIQDASPARAMSVKSARAIEDDRLARARKRAVSTTEEQRAKALDLVILTRGARQLAEFERAHGRRAAALDKEIEGGRAESYKHLGSYYLVQARTAPRAPDRVTFLDRAERYAKASGSKELLEEVRKAKDKKE